MHTVIALNTKTFAEQSYICCSNTDIQLDADLFTFDSFHEEIIQSFKHYFTDQSFT